jgi:hypothetical protein
VDDGPIPIGSVVEIGWGEPREDITAVVHRWTPDGVILSLLSGLTQIPGYEWLAAAAVDSVTVVADDAPAVRHLRAVGIRCDAAQVEHDSLTAVLEMLQRTGELVLFQDVDDGSDAASVGRVLRIDDEAVVFSDIDLDGREAGDELVRQLDDIDRIVWDDDYMRALTVLNGLG